MIDEIIGFTIFHLIVNVIGGTLRWIYGSVWRTIFNKPKFTFKEYLWGPKKSKDYYDKHHLFNNGFVAIIFIIALGFLINWIR